MVFCSFDPEDLRVELSSSIGIRHLRAYLEFARDGALPDAVGETEPGTTTGINHGTSVTQLTTGPRERRHVVDRHRQTIAEALRAKGLEVETNVGMSDFTIDLTVGLAGQQPCTAILLDGPGWEARHTTMDRDGLPVAVLRDAMGWPAVERVWLPTWLADRDGVVTELVAAVTAAAQAQRRTGERIIATGYAAPHESTTIEDSSTPQDSSQRRPRPMTSPRTRHRIRRRIWGCPAQRPINHFR